MPCVRHRWVNNVRYTHIIKRNETSETPYRAIWLQVHTKRLNHVDGVEQHRLEFVWCCHGVKRGRSGEWSNHFYRFDSAILFWRWLDTVVEPKTRTYILCRHSSMTLAALDAFTIAYKSGWTLTRAIIECPPCIVSWRKEQSTIKWLDAANVWPTLSAGISNGNALLSSREKTEPGDRLTPDARTKQDVAMMQSLWVEWWDFLANNDMAGFAPTIASQSMRIFRHKYMQHEILIDVNEDALKLARYGYVGARTECFYIGRMDGEFYLLDINSMYASVMRDMQVPVRLKGYTEHATVNDLEHWIASTCVIADCDIRTKDTAYPYRINGKLIFPKGAFRTVLAGSEVALASGRHEIERVHRVAVYEQAPAFTKFVSSMWDLRRAYMENGQHEDADKYKLLLASFYGKWGQSGGVWETIEDVNDATIKTWINVDWHTNEVTEFRQFGGIVQQRSTEPESFESHPAIAACVTANARMLLWKYMTTAGLEHVYYVDTDSLLLDEEGRDRLASFIDPTKLGGLRLEGVYTQVQLNAPKDYCFDNRKRLKGIRPGSLAIDHSTYEQTQLRSLVGMIRDGDLSTLTTRRVRRKMVRKYSKGIVSDTGKVGPIEL